MFNPKKAAKYIARMLIRIVPILCMALVLGLVTELNQRGKPLAELVGSWQFWLAIGRDMLPAIAAISAVHLLSRQFVLHLYNIKDAAEAGAFVKRSLFGLLKFGPWLKVANGVVEGNDDHVAKRIGGPGNLVIYGDSAVIVEKAGRFTKALLSGFAPLDPFERPYHSIDLRPKRWVYAVSAMSQDGIPITCDADITYQVDSDGEVATEAKPFITTPEMALRAATCTWIRESDRPEEFRTMDWGGRVIISETEGALRTLLAQYPLDRLISPLGTYDVTARDEIRAKLEAALKAGVPKLGARILRVDLGDIKIEDKITQQWVELWQAKWERYVAEQQGQGLASQVEQLEDAKSQAQVMMLKSIIEAFQPFVPRPATTASGWEEQEITGQLIMTRLSMVMSRVAADPLAKIYLPQEALKSIQLLEGPAAASATIDSPGSGPAAPGATGPGAGSTPAGPGGTAPPGAGPTAPGGVPPASTPGVS